MANGESKERNASRRAGKVGGRGSNKLPRQTAQGEAESRSLGSKVPLADGTDRAWKVAQIAATLATRYVVHPGQSNTGATDAGDWTLARDEATPELDGFYLSLLRRAEFLLAHGEARAGEIHASQLFDPTQHYSIKEIAAEFLQAGWTGLTSENSVRSLLKEIGKEMDRRAQAELKHLLQITLDPQSVRDRQDAKHPEGERSEIERQVAALLEAPDSIKTHPRIPLAIKERAGLIHLRRKLIRDSLGQGEGQLGINPYMAFGACKDDRVLVEKLWRRRADLSQIYPL